MAPVSGQTEVTNPAHIGREKAPLCVTAESRSRYISMKTIKQHEGFGLFSVPRVKGPSHSGSIAAIRRTRHGVTRAHVKDLGVRALKQFLLMMGSLASESTRGGNLESASPDAGCYMRTDNLPSRLDTAAALSASRWARLEPALPSQKVRWSTASCGGPDPSPT